MFGPIKTEHEILLLCFSYKGAKEKKKVNSL